ncbi:MAG: fluoride efflux transporter FluC [Natronosporangium sp.]
MDRSRSPGRTAGAGLLEPDDATGPRRAPWLVLVTVSIGGGLGSLARYGVGAALPTQPAGFPWPTFAVNVTGCLLIGVLMVLVGRVWPGRRLLRPFLGVGVLGGLTTFSLPMVEAQRLVDAGTPAVALAYLSGTAVAGLAAVLAGLAGTRWAVARVAFR